MTTNENNILNLKEEIDKLVNERLGKDKSEKAIVDNTPSMVSHPKHYNRENAMECIDEMELIFGPEVVAHFCLCNVFKYRYRAGLKDNGYQDLEKSDWYMQKYKEYKDKTKPRYTISTNEINNNPILNSVHC